jgi:hypothetical protein
MSGVLVNCQLVGGADEDQPYRVHQLLFAANLTCLLIFAQTEEDRRAQFSITGSSAGMA